MSTEGKGGAHADSPRWQEKGTSSLLSAVSDPFPAVVQKEAVLLQTAALWGIRCSSLTISFLQQDSESTGGTASV